MSLTPRELPPDEVKALLATENPPLLLDVREASEIATGQLPNAVHITRSLIEQKIEQVVPNRDTPIVIYCGGGGRSLLAANRLLQMGYTHVTSLVGGIRGWQRAGLETVVPPTVLTAAEQQRYSRHLSIPEVGESGQLKLRQTKVLLVGAGGLGSPAAYYLAAAGVGTLGIIDNDQVDLSNLQRQILHTTDRIGQPKATSAQQSLSALNPHITVHALNDRLTAANVIETFNPYDLIIDGSDNFATRYLINDACVLLKKPFVHGSVLRFAGNVTLFDPVNGPCYRCLYPAPPPNEIAPSCAEAGVLGILPGVIGTLQATEALKWILGTGDLLVGRLLTYDALSSQFRYMKIIKDPDCRYCRQGSAFPGFVDYQQSCVTSIG